MSRRIPRRATGGVAILVLVAVSACRTASPPAPAAAPPPAAAPAAPAFDRSGLDTTCAPCRDFFQFANGGWLARTEIPAAFPSWGSFNELQTKNLDVLHAVLDAATREAGAGAGAGASGSDRAKLGRFYASCMDSAGAEAAGAGVLAPELERIARIGSVADLEAVVAHLHRLGVGALFQFRAEPDAKHSAEVIATVAQGGLGLPDRDYYTKTDSAAARLQREYVGHVARTLGLLGTPAAQAETAAARVMAIESALAAASMTRVERRDPNAIYHKLATSELEGLMPAFRWPEYFRLTGAPAVAALNVEQPGFFRALDTLLARTPLDDWRWYLRWHLAAEASPWLGRAFADEAFRFQQLLTGVTEQQPRWRRCVQATDRFLGDAAGRAYVERAFSPAAKARALDMVHNLEAVMRDRLHGLEWMSEATRAQALAKLEAYANKIGYPDRWRDYAGLEVERGPFWPNLARAAAFVRARELAKIGRPVDRSEWRMTPPTVNAYYNPRMNEIVFPAGILQPPFFNPAADDAINYGGMGAVIGHELTHGFDDQGRQYDAQGNLRDWWTADDAARFRAQAQLVVDQFAGYVAVDTLRVNGRLTLGENLADLNGLRIAYAAFERALAGKPRPPLIDGFTPEQRFFLGWAQVWRQKTRDDYARLLVTVDPHSPARWRVNGPLANMPEFARAFGCRAGDPMVRPDSLRPRMW